MATWTLEQELNDVVGTADPARLAAIAGLSADATYELEPQSDTWFRHGLEQYCFIFALISEGISTPFALRACVAYHPTLRPPQLLDTWLGRRNVLTAAGVSVPPLLGRGPAVYCDAWLSQPITSALSGAGQSETSRDSLVASIGRTIATLARLGFVPLDIAGVLGIYRDSATVTQYGQDLGPPKMDPSANLVPRLLSEFLAQVEGDSIHLPAEEVSMMWRAAESVRET